VQAPQARPPIAFWDQSSGGTARVNLMSFGTMDISASSGILAGSMSTTGITVGSIEGSGTIFLGGNTLAVGGNNLQTVFSGVIQDGGLNGGTGGSLTVAGGGLTLTGINTYTGATTVNGGFLVVDGSIASSSGVTVGSGGTLAGTGTVASTLVNDGGRLLAGGAGAFNDPASFGTLTVQGNLTFTAAATYFVQVSPAAAASTTVTGTAMLSGATVQANFAPGSYVTKQYNILHAGAPLSDKFGNLVNSNLSPFFTASLSYDANNVFLNLSAAAPDANAAGFNTNQRHVANSIVSSFNLMNGVPGAFATLTPAGMTQVSGENAVGTQQATFDAMNQFMGVMLDPTVGGRGGAPNDANASMARKAPLAEAFDARWGVWAAGFGGSQSTNGDATVGSNKTTSNVFGSAAGADYRFSPNTVAGFALAGGGTNFRVANGGSGNSDLFQAGAYLRHTQGAAFLSAALAYGWQDVTTNRTVTVAGIDSLRGRFNADAISGRLEGGYKVATQAGEFTPYAAGQFTSYHLPSYAEQVAFGANTFAIAYNGKDVTATRSELGLRSEKAVALTDATLMLRGRLAWAHDFNTDRNVQATFQTLPGSAFVVNGAQPAADTALTTVSAEMLWRNGWSAAATADAQLYDTTHSYSGKGVVRYNW
jgi:autotransporter-associated beta strand protein